MKLTGDLKKKVEGAPSREAKKAAIEQAGMLLTDDELNKVAGGAIFDATGIAGHDAGLSWEVLNEKGEIVGHAADREEAASLAGPLGVSGDEVSWDAVKRMRGQE